MEKPPEKKTRKNTLKKVPQKNTGNKRPGKDTKNTRKNLQQSPAKKNPAKTLRKNKFQPKKRVDITPKLRFLVVLSSFKTFLKHPLVKKISHVLVTKLLGIFSLEDKFRH